MRGRSEMIVPPKTDRNHIQFKSNQSNRPKARPVRFSRSSHQSHHRLLYVRLFITQPPPNMKSRGSRHNRSRSIEGAAGVGSDHFSEVEGGACLPAGPNSLRLLSSIGSSGRG